MADVTYVQRFKNFSEFLTRSLIYSCSVTLMSPKSTLCLAHFKKWFVLKGNVLKFLHGKFKICAAFHTFIHTYFMHQFLTAF